MKRIGLGLVFVLAAAGIACAQTVDRVEISNAGIYRLRIDGVEPAPNSALGVFKTVSNPVLVERTERVAGAKGTNFGFNFQIAGAPQGQLVTVRFVTRFPPPGLRDPRTGKVLLTSENDRQYRIGELAFRSYGFDEEWEIVPGTWSLEFWYGGKLVGAQKFQVVKAEAAPKSDRDDRPSDNPTR
ncbi:MAG: DUF3859 domain-containing protein [Xanthobacteraceae bacterium]|nr:DUF3859 domain-containing protein [Xanthobacteraceae bacterium]